MHYSIRALSSAYYNLGGMLYNAGVPENALAFAQRACDLGDAALESARTRDRIESRPSELVESMGALAIKDGESESPSSKDEERKQERDAVTDLERLMSRRWNLLALTQRALGDKRVSFKRVVKLH
jgi:separase